MNTKLLIGDQVVVTAGSAKGQSGTVKSINMKTGRITVEGVNMRSHYKKTSETAYEKVEYPAPMAISNVMVVDPKTKKPTRVGFDMSSGSKVRVAKKSGESLVVVR